MKLIILTGNIKISEVPKDEGKTSKTVIPIKTDRNQTKDVSDVVQSFSILDGFIYLVVEYCKILIRRLNSYSA
jgi:hypothetical protein